MKKNIVLLSLFLGEGFNLLFQVSVYTDGSHGLVAPVSKTITYDPVTNIPKGSVLTPVSRRKTPLLLE